MKVSFPVHTKTCGGSRRDPRVASLIRVGVVPRCSTRLVGMLKTCIGSAIEYANVARWSSPNSDTLNFAKAVQRTRMGRRGIMLFLAAY